MVRRFPRRHTVREHGREGSPVGSYERGEGGTTRPLDAPYEPAPFSRPVEEPPGSMHYYDEAYRKAGKVARNLDKFPEYKKWYRARYGKEGHPSDREAIQKRKTAKWGSTLDSSIEASRSQPLD